MGGRKVLEQGGKGGVGAGEEGRCWSRGGREVLEQEGKGGVGAGQEGRCWSRGGGRCRCWNRGGKEVSLYKNSLYLIQRPGVKILITKRCSKPQVTMLSQLKFIMLLLKCNVQHRIEWVGKWRLAKQSNITNCIQSKNRKL